MRNVLRVLVLLAVLVAALTLSSPAQAATLHGKYLQSCGHANSAQVDPLVSPGETADHPHDQFGALNWGTSTTTGDMLAGGTSCFIPGNKAAYWVSAMEKPDGTLVHATSTSGYYGAFGANTETIPGGKVQPFPVGIRFLVGNPKSTVRQSTSVVRWRCNQAGQQTVSAPPTTCPPGVGVSLEFASQPCWDGMRLDSPDHRSHMANGVTGGNCPSTHPVRVPLLNWQFNYPPDAVGACPASDHGIAPCGRSAHMDLWEAQDSFSQALLTQCLNDPSRTSPTSPLCGVLTYTASPWLANLKAWASKLDYIAAPNGNAAARTAP